MRYLIILITALFILVSCSGVDYPPPYTKTIQYFCIIDSQGNNLLDPNNNRIDFDAIKIIKVKDGKEEIDSEFFENRDYSPDLTQGFGVIRNINDISKYLMYIDLNISTSEKNYSYTIIQWSKYERDTIIAIVNKNDEYTESKMISFNDSVWSPINDYDIFTIVK